MNRYLIPDDFVERADCKLETLSYQLDLTGGRVHDAVMTGLPTTSATDDLGIITSYGTSSPQIQTSDLKAAGATTRYARYVWNLPPEYVAGESVIVRCAAEMVTTVADTTCTLDLNCYSSDEDGTVSADLCTTAATTMNSLTLADIDFTITATALSPGEQLDFRLAIICNDAAAITTVIGSVAAVHIRIGARG